MNDEKLIWERYKLIKETPIDDISVMGFDNQTDTHGYDEGSMKAITDPRYINKLKKTLVKKLDVKTNNKFNFNFGFCKSKYGDEKAELGLSTPEELKQRFPDVDLSNFLKKCNNNNISVLFANNSSLDRFPLSPWIIIHRLGHTLFSKKESREFYIKLRDEIFPNFLKKCPITDKEGNHYYYEEVYIPPKRRDDPWFVKQPSSNINIRQMTKHGFTDIFSKLGTFRSARENKIDRGMEFIIECFTQYVITGKVTFNHNFNLGDVTQKDVIRLEKDLEINIHSILENAVGSIFSM
jgi:hypothetical protein